MLNPLVRFGGQHAPEGFLFELTGGVLCLDFVNTVDDRPTEAPKELLTGYTDLVSWAIQAGGIPRDLGARLQVIGAARPEQAMAVLTGARHLREALYQVFSAAAAKRPPSVAALEELNRALALYNRRLRLAYSGPLYEVTWASGPDSLDRMVPPVLQSAVDLLCSPRLANLRECVSPSCGWLFLDHSKNRSRKWCDITVCGNRDRVRRFRAARRSTERPT